MPRQAAGGGWRRTTWVSSYARSRWVHQNEPDEANHEQHGSSRLDVETVHVRGDSPLQDRAGGDQHNARPNRHALGLPALTHRYPRLDDRSEFIERSMTRRRQSAR
jgi:hypothetical protein